MVSSHPRGWRAHRFKDRLIAVIGSGPANVLLRLTAPSDPHCLRKA
jgi:hypothetical protein